MLVMVEHVFNPCTGEFIDSLVYKVSSMPARATLLGSTATP